jgi:hypothetical protein
MAESRGRLQADIQRGGTVVGERERTLLLAFRQALIIALGALEDYLGLERSIVSKRSRKAA